MAGVYCDRCQTNVLLEQDGQSCSNCGTKLVIRAPKPPPPPRKADPPPAGLTQKPERRPKRHPKQ